MDDYSDNRRKRIAISHLSMNGTSSPPRHKIEPRKRRNRPALSCSECKRRKIKCSRVIPCEACVKRGDEATCHWEDKNATNGHEDDHHHDLSHLEERLNLIESILLKTPEGIVSHEDREALRRVSWDYASLPNSLKKIIAQDGGREADEMGSDTEGK